MSMTSTSPACALPGSIHRPGLAAWNVAVAAARTAAPATSPVEASTPLGTSAATTGAPAGVDRLDRAAAPARAARRRSPCRASRRRPRPRRPARRARTARARPRSRSRFAARVAAQLRGRAAARRTSRPASRSRRAATSPSPPLLPLPQTTATGPPSARPRRRRAASPAPARSIRSSDGMPALLDRPAVGRAHLLGVGQRLEPAAGSPRRPPPPPAIAALWVSETATAPRAGQRAVQHDLAARRRGRDDLDVLPATTPRARSALATASLAQNRAARCCAGPRARGGVGALAVGEQPLGQPRAPLERPLQALDLQQVDADAAHGDDSSSEVRSSRGSSPDLERRRDSGARPPTAAARRRTGLVEDIRGATCRTARRPSARSTRARGRRAASTRAGRSTRAASRERSRLERRVRARVAVADDGRRGSS